MKSLHSHPCQPGNRLRRPLVLASDPGRRQGGARRHLVPAVIMGVAAALVAVDLFAAIAQTPLTVTRSIRPLVMLAMSNDHQLYQQAYDDLSDIDGDGAIETTYDNANDYYGYFDPDTCYVYEHQTFVPKSDAVNHQCSGRWSGNFLNWATMTRMDLLRRVLYGGKRSTDTSSKTVLERALIPRDHHAFVKVFRGNAGLYTPYWNYTGSSLSICNATIASSGVSNTLDTVDHPPLIRVSPGTYPVWAAGDASTGQMPCAWRNESGSNTSPVYEFSWYGFTWTLGAEFVVRTEVCVDGLDGESESCKRYPQEGSVKKPIGILQKYGDDQALRYGLMTGSYVKGTSGGVLRRNVGFLAGNGDSALDEVDLGNGTFTGAEGIISTIDGFRINQYDFATGTYADSCQSAATSQISDGTCTNWGNPVAEIVLESLRYLAGKDAALTAFDTDDSTYFSALEPVAWVDPIAIDEWCVSANLLALSGGVNSFDRDQLSNDISGLVASVETNKVGSAEGINGRYILGGNASASDGNCYGRRISNLSEAHGVCPSGGKLKGGWDVAGLSYFAKVNDLRDDRDSPQHVTTRAIDMPDEMPHFRIRANGDQFQGWFTLTPFCVTNPDPNAELPGARDLLEEIGFGAVVEASEEEGWSQCALWEVLPYNLVFDSDGYVVGGDLYAFWEDTPYGTDSDMDAISRVHFCVGDDPTGRTSSSPNVSLACSDNPLDEGWGVGKDPGSYTLPNVNKDYELRVTTSVVQAYTDRSLAFGFVISGAHNPNSPNDFHCDNGYHGDGLYLEEVVHGIIMEEITVPSDKKNKKNTTQQVEAPGAFSVLNTDLRTGDDNPQRQPGACGRKFRPDQEVPMLKPPLWYAAKYGGFEDANENNLPDTADGLSEWDKNGDGTPDAYHLLYAPQRIGESFESIFETIAGASSSSSVVANTSSLQDGTYIFQGRFDSNNWTGDLVGFPLNQDGTVGEAAWHARNELESNLSRVILTASDLVEEGSFVGVPFAWDDLSVAQQTLLQTNPAENDPTPTSDGPERLAYLRGSRVNELQNSGTYRDRDYLLADIVNSDPVFVGPPPFSYPDDLEGTTQAASYVGFVYNNETRHPLVYVGANDGMLHGFSARTGEELLAYVPRAVYPNLWRLTQRDYQQNHRYFVDGGVLAADIFADAAWKTIIIATTGAGGKGVFALDVTDPDSFSEDNADDLVLWDRSAEDADLADLGHVLGRASVVRLPDTLNDGAWVVLLGNGYESTNGKAILYVLDAESGELLYNLPTDEVGPKNGLSTPAAVDVDGDAKIDYVYAGDLQGNLWRFNASNEAGPSGVGLGGEPLFVAKDANGVRQPITTAPEVLAHPMGGVVVVFGTGKFYETSDTTRDPSIVNTLYGVWDRLNDADDPQGEGAQITRAKLLQQEFIAETSAETFNVRISSNYPLTWYFGAGFPDDPVADGYLGWYLDLVDLSTGQSLGEKVATDVRARGRRVIFTTMIPSDRPCDYGGSGWLVELNGIDGTRPEEVLFDLNWDGAFDAADMANIPVAGTDTVQLVNPNAKQSKIGIIQAPAIISAGAMEYKYASGGIPAQIEVTRENPGEADGGRMSWKQLR